MNTNDISSLSLLLPFTMDNDILIYFFWLEVINSKRKAKGKLGHNVQIHVFRECDYKSL